jgi:hypothetical protein
MEAIRRNDQQGSKQSSVLIGVLYQAAPADEEIKSVAAFWVADKSTVP